MPICPELKAKIDALEDEDLRVRILRVLNGPGKKKGSDEEIYGLILSGYTFAKEQRARLLKWKDDEVVAFAQHFMQQMPGEYRNFLQQEKEFNEIEATLAWTVRRLISEWLPGIEASDSNALFGKFRDYTRCNLI